MPTNSPSSSTDHQGRQSEASTLASEDLLDDDASFSPRSESREKDEEETTVSDVNPVLANTLQVSIVANDSIPLLISGHYEAGKLDYYHTNLDGIFADVSAYEVTISPRSAECSNELKQAVFTALNKVRQEEVSYPRWDSFSRFPPYVYEEGGVVRIGGALTFDEVRRLYEELDTVIAPTLETAKSMSHAADAELRSPIRSSTKDLNDRVDYGLSLDKRVGNYQSMKNSDLLPQVIKDLRHLFCTFEISETELKRRTALVAFQLLTGQIEDGSGRYLPLNDRGQSNVSQQDASENVAESGTSLVEVQRLLLEEARTTANDLLLEITEGHFDLAGPKERVKLYKWQIERRREIAAADLKSFKSPAISYITGSYEGDIDYFNERFDTTPQDEKPVTENALTATKRALKQRLAAYDFLERSYLGNTKTQEELREKGTFTIQEDDTNFNGYHSRQPFSNMIARQRLPKVLEKLLQEADAEPSVISGLLGAVTQG